MVEEDNSSLDDIRDDDSSEEGEIYGDFYTPKSELPKPKLVAEQIQAILKARTTEMRPGWINRTTNKNGDITLQDIPDPRKVYIAGVDALRFLLSPEIIKDDKSNKFVIEFDKKIKDCFKKWAYEEYQIGHTKPTLQYPNGYLAPIKTGRIWMPLKDEVLLNPVTQQMEQGMWNNHVNSYINELIKIYDELFGELNCLIDRLGYYKPSVSF